MFDRKSKKSAEKETKEKTIAGGQSETVDSGSVTQSSKSDGILDSKHLIYLAYVCWFVTVVYVCFKLPYPLLVGLVVVTGTGAVVYAKQEREKSFRYSLPGISRMAAMMVLNIGNENNGRRNRRRTFQAPSFAEGFSMSPPDSSGLNPAVGGRAAMEKIPLYRSHSEGELKQIKVNDFGDEAVL